MGLVATDYALGCYRLCVEGFKCRGILPGGFEGIATDYALNVLSVGSYRLCVPQNVMKPFLPCYRLCVDNDGGNFIEMAVGLEIAGRCCYRLCVGLVT